MRVIFVSRHGFSVIVYHHVSNIAFNATTGEYTVTYPVNNSSTTATISNTYYIAQIMGLSPADATNASSSGSESGSAGSGT